MFPNPAFEYTSVLLNSNTELSKVELFSLDGKETDVIVEYKSNMIATIKTNTLNKGLYLVKIYTTDGRWAFRKLQID
jgi:hypothetical protein